MSKASHHDLGISLEFLTIHEQLPYRKVVCLCAFNCDYHAQNRATVCTHIHKEHLNTMLGCPHCNHHVWSTNTWVKHVKHHHPELPMFLELKLEHVSSVESAEVLETISVPQDVKK